jgi:hypothetical protein
MKNLGFTGFDRGKEGSTAKHLSVVDYKLQKRKQELAEKENQLKLSDMELEDSQTAIVRTKATNANLEAERDKLEKEIAPMRELRKLRIKTTEIKIPDKPKLGTTVKMPYTDVVKLKEMSDAYTANEAEIKDIRKRRAAVKTREDNAIAKDNELVATENALIDREKIVASQEEALSTAENVKYKYDILQKHSDTQSEKIENLIGERDSLCEKLKKAFDAITHIVKAVKLLQYGREHLLDYKIETLTPIQETLIDALYEYSAKLADKNNFAYHANQMRRNMNLDEGIKSEMKIINPQIFPHEKQKSRAAYDQNRG